MTSSKETKGKKDGVPGEEKRIVHFFISGDDYAVPIESVKEIIYAKTIRPLPGAVSGIEGMIDLRGRVIPVIDLRKKLKMNASEYGSAQHILIVEVRRQKLGLIVDRVVEVMAIGESQIQNMKPVLDKNAPYVGGVYRIASQLIVLLDLEQLWTEMELSQIESTVSAVDSN